jgi:hypothetical protein
VRENLKKSRLAKAFVVEVEGISGRLG